jgi:hypothetical protein
MKKNTIAKTVIVCVTIALSGFIECQETHFQQLYVMAGGTWVMKTKKGFICEQWQKVSNAEMHNRGFRITGKDTVEVEKIQLIEKGDEVYYISTVKGQNEGKPVTFRLADVKGHQFTFSNPKHDYPQFIVYDIVSKDSIHAWVDGIDKGKSLKIDFYYRRKQG